MSSRGHSPPAGEWLSGGTKVTLRNIDSVASGQFFLDAGANVFRQIYPLPLRLALVPNCDPDRGSSSFCRRHFRRVLNVPRAFPVRLSAACLSKDSFSISVENPLM